MSSRLVELVHMYPSPKLLMRPIRGFFYYVFVVWILFCFLTKLRHALRIRCITYRTAYGPVTDVITI
ncbi:spt3 dosage dependent suppressor of ty-induced promoter mutations-like protein [Moniliophthora roreri]|nr:spt3 dosage dependent suppressor of ty-induced promoter mutations-like protein [Moniliophthora roreri]